MYSVRNWIIETIIVVKHVATRRRKWYVLTCRLGTSVTHIKIYILYIKIKTLIEIFYFKKIRIKMDTFDLKLINITITISNNN